MISNIQENKKLNVSINSIFRFFVLTYVFLLPIGTGLSGIIGSVSLMNYFAAGIIVFGLLVCAKNGKITIPYHCLPTLLYCLYTVISSFWVSKININWYVMTNMVNCIIIFVLNSYKWNEREIDKIVKWVLLSQLIVIVAVLKNINTVNQYRLSITIVSTIGISDFACGLCLIIAAWMNLASVANKKIFRMLAYGFIAIDFAIIMLSGSRGALAMFAVMTVIWVLMGNSSGKSKIITVLLIAVAFLFFAEYFIKLLPDSIVNRLSISAISETHGSGRYNVWYLAWKRFVDSSFLRAIFGYGFNSFIDVIQYGSFGGLKDLLAHNVVIQTMIEGGIIGLILLFAMLLSNLLLAWKTKDTLMKIALTGLIVAALSIDMQVTRIWGFIFAFNLIRTDVNGDDKK